MEADSTDPDQVGFQQWRVAFYIAGEDGACLNFLNLLDDFLSWKLKQMAKEVEIHLYPYLGVDELTEEKIQEELSLTYIVHEPASDLPLKWNHAAPVMGKRVVTVTLRCASEDTLRLIWSGNTWAFRDAMDEAGVKGAV